MSTAQRAAAMLGVTADTLRDRDAEYRGSDQMYAEVMARRFPDGITLKTERDHHRFHFLMLMEIKFDRYVRNWATGHPDSLTDLAAYATMLAAIDADGD